MNILNKLNNDFKNYNFQKIESGASKKILYRLKKDDKSYILIDFNKVENEYDDHLKIYKILKDINISIPIIIEKFDNNFILITEDFGDLRFDKILNNYKLKDLISYAVDTLIILKNSLPLNNHLKLPKYNLNILKNEISELPNFYFPYIGLKNENLIDEFMYIWSQSYLNYSFSYDSFVHKDFNINNLILLPQQKDYLKCGVIDFQNSFLGESSWDLFSLLEDSRILFSDEFNEYFIKYFYSKINLGISFSNFKMKFYFLNCTRQSRLLGRWVKLSKDYNQNHYLNFIPVTLARLKKSINLLDDKNLITFYNKYIFN